DIGAPPASDDLGHRRMVAGKPVGRPEAVGNLLPREGQGAAGHLFARGVNGGRWRRTSRRRRLGNGVRPLGNGGGRSQKSGYGEQHQAERASSDKRAHAMSLLCQPRIGGNSRDCGPTSYFSGTRTDSFWAICHWPLLPQDLRNQLSDSSILSAGDSPEAG